MNNEPTWLFVLQILFAGSGLVGLAALLKWVGDGVKGLLNAGPAREAGRLANEATRQDIEAKKKEDKAKEEDMLLKMQRLLETRLGEVRTDLDTERQKSDRQDEDLRKLREIQRVRDSELVQITAQGVAATLRVTQLEELARKNIELGTALEAKFEAANKQRYKLIEEVAALKEELRTSYEHTGALMLETLKLISAGLVGITSQLSAIGKRVLKVTGILSGVLTTLTEQGINGTVATKVSEAAKEADGAGNDILTVWQTMEETATRVTEKLKEYLPARKHTGEHASLELPVVLTAAQVATDVALADERQAVAVIATPSPTPTEPAAPKRQLR